MTTLPKRLTFVLTLSLFSNVVAQPTHFSFQKVDGLSQNTVFNIYQDKQGFLWVATGDGLNRYDGKTFRAYKPSPTSESGFITGRVIRNKIVEGSKDNLWISTESGLHSFDKKRNSFKYYVPFEDSFNYANGSLYPITEKDGLLWFGKSNSGILSLSVKTKKFTSYPFPNDGVFNYYADENVAFDKDGNAWFSREAGLYCFNVKTNKWKSYLQHLRLKQICILGNELFIALPNGLIVFDIQKETFYNIPTNPLTTRINTIACGPANTVWLGDASGAVYKINRDLKQLILVGNINKASGNVFPVYDLYFDASGILWIGTDGMGLLKANVDPPQFYKYPKGEQSEELFIKSIYEDAAGTIWLGTFGHGIVLLDRKSETASPIKRYPFNIKDNKKYIVSFIREDLKQNVWVGFGHKLYVKKNNTLSFAEVQIPSNLNADKLRVTGMFPFEQKVLITTTIGCFAFEENQYKKFEAVEGSYAIGDFTFLFQKNKSQYITGYLEGGLHEYNLSTTGIWKPEKALLKNIGIKCLYNDASGKFLWLGTDKGLVVYKLEDETYRIYAEQDGLNNSFIYGILESHGELWISTNGGVSNVKVTTPHPDSFPEIICRNYKLKDGLQSDEFNTNAFLKGRDGTLYFGGIKGINWFNPKIVLPKKNIPQVVIVKFLVNNEPADTIAPEFIDTVVLPYTKNNLYLQFCGLEFSDPDRINYAFMLEGWDKNFIESNINEVRYNNLPPGKYVFKALASNEKTSDLQRARSIVIHILPPYWKTWWFYCIVSILSISLLLWAFKLNSNWRVKKERAKLQQQKEMYNERMRIAREMHDDIGAGLTQISLISASAKLHGPVANRTGSDLEAISNTARKLVDNLSEIIWALNPGYNSVDMLLSHLREQVSKLTEYADISCRIQIGEDIPNHNLTNQQRRNILLVTKEIVHNSIKHCAGKNLIVDVSFKNERLHFDITDDGEGFDTGKTYAGSGLKNIRHRIEEIGGKLDLQSAPGTGCRFQYHFPLA